MIDGSSVFFSCINHTIDSPLQFSLDVLNFERISEMEYENNVLCMQLEAHMFEIRNSTIFLL